MMIKRTGYGIWLFLVLSGLGIGSFSAFDNFYFREMGYSVTVIGALAATFTISVALAEIPSAIIFDRKSHWVAIQVGNGLRFLGLAIFFLALGPLGDFSAEVLAGIGAAAMSGTSVAYIINRLGRSTDYQLRRAIGAITLLGAATSLAGAGLGFIAFTHNPRYVWGLGALFMALAGIAFFFGRPSVRDASDRPVEPLKSYLAGLYTIAFHPRARVVIFADAALVAPFLLWQLRLGDTSLTAVFAGFTVMKIAGILGSHLIRHRHVKRRGFYVIIFLNILAISGFATFENVALIIICFGLHVLFHIAVSVYCQAEFQSVIDSSQRAGATSVVSLLSSFVTGVVAVIVGRFADLGDPFLATLPSIALYGAVALLASLPELPDEPPKRA
ncbi:MFS transporter [Devriesea agamarum]|uniref:MFS transporter n=1 Tax=Devriesea agamarum TaxID=472569 RepID=UPI000B09A9A8|nr:MFS transporter [Devriesea agamarum]